MLGSRDVINLSMLKKSGQVFLQLRLMTQGKVGNLALPSKTSVSETYFFQVRYASHIRHLNTPLDWIVISITWIQNLRKHPSPQWNNCFSNSSGSSY